MSLTCTTTTGAFTGSSSNSSSSSMGKKMVVSSTPLPNLYRTCLLPTLMLCVALAGIFQEQIQDQVTLFQSKQQQHDSRGNNHMNKMMKMNRNNKSKLFPKTFQSVAVFAVVLVEHQHQHQHDGTTTMPNLFSILDEDTDDDDETSTFSKPSRPSFERARRRHRHREALEEQQQEFLQSLPRVTAEKLRTAIQLHFGAEPLEQAAAQQCERHNSHGSSTSNSTTESDSEVCESAAVSIYDKEATEYIDVLQAVGWLVSVPSKHDVEAMAAKLNQVATVQDMGTVYAVRIHVDSCDATYVQYTYVYEAPSDSVARVASDDDKNHGMVNVNDSNTNIRSNGIVRRHIRRIVQFWKRLRRGKGKRQQQQKEERKEQETQQQHERQQKREHKEQQQQEQQQYKWHSRTLTNTTTVLRSPSLWLAAARTLAPGRDRFQCLIRTESTVHTQW